MTDNNHFVFGPENVTELREFVARGLRLCSESAAVNAGREAEAHAHLLTLFLDGLAAKMADSGMAQEDADQLLAHVLADADAIARISPTAGRA